MNKNKRLPIIYISGPMEGKPDMNILRFTQMENVLLKMGYNPMNPFDMETDEDYQYTKHPTRQDYYRKDIRVLTYSDEIVMLRGWQMSHGSQLERQVAFEIGLKIRYEEELQKTEEGIHYFAER